MLEVEGVSVRYGPVTAVREISLSVEESETVAVLGPNGAGKSTLLRAISGQIRCHAGRIRLDGERIDRLPARRVAALGIGHVPEGRHVFAEMSVEENLVVGGYRFRSKRDRIRAGLDEVYDLFPRLAERRRQDASSLSGGEQQMLALGRALIAQPRLLMLDEPSLGLAPIMVSRVFEAIARLQERGLTLLLVEQNAAVALRQASRGYVLSLGAVATAGSADALQRDSSVKRAYLGAPPEEGASAAGREEHAPEPIAIRRFRDG